MGSPHPLFPELVSSVCLIEFQYLLETENFEFHEERLKVVKVILQLEIDNPGILLCLQLAELDGRNHGHFCPGRELVKFLLWTCKLDGPICRCYQAIFFGRDDWRKKVCELNGLPV